MSTASRSARGFTLIEMLITVSIIAIISAIAIPSYQEQIRRTRRADARQELMRFATAQERFYTNCNRFAPALNGATATCSGLDGAGATVNSSNGYYSISMVSDGVTYTLTATPLLAQVADTGCANLTLTDAGVKGASGTLGPAACW